MYCSSLSRCSAHWDTAAGVLIVEEAGGRITKLNGEEYSIYDNQILGSNLTLHNDLMLNISKQIRL